MGSGFKSFQPNTVLTASDVQGYLQDQAVMSFATGAARGSAITSPVEGMPSYLANSNRFQIYNGAVWQSYTPGLVPVSPTSVDYSGGAAPTVSAMGEVIGSGKTGLSLNGVFTSAFRNYRVLIWTVGSTTHDVSFRLRAGTDSIASYNWTSVAGNFNVLGRGVGNNTTEFQIGTATTSIKYTVLEFTRPAEVVPTVVLGESSTYNANGTEIVHLGGLHNVTAAYDGLSILTFAGNLTIIAQVFGYNHN